MKELVGAIEAMARAHGVEPSRRLVSRYVSHLAGWPEHLATRAVRDASARNSRLPAPQQVVARLQRWT